MKIIDIEKFNLEPFSSEILQTKTYLRVIN